MKEWTLLKKKGWGERSLIWTYDIERRGLKGKGDLLSWRHRNHVNTITSVIEAKQTAINEVVFFSIKFCYSDNLLKNT